MNRSNQNYRIPIFRPFTFILKEGKEIKNNRLDYSLMLLQTGRAEIIASPKVGDRLGFFIGR